jgi:membrane-bound inhibitor of C-type lysozyme
MTNMNSRSAAAIFAVAFFVVVVGAAAVSSPGMAQSFQSYRYRCADGSQFIVGFFQYDSRAHMQIDGRAVTLARRFTLSGSRYSGGGVTFRMMKAGTTVRHAGRPATACELM